MTEYTEILVSDLEPSDPLTATQVQAFRNNHLAVDELDQTAIDAGRYSAGAWYVVGQAPIWSFATDGAIAQITTPEFEAGYNYRVVFEGLTASVSKNLEVSLRESETPAYRTILLTAGTVATSGFVSGEFRLPNPMRISQMHAVGFFAFFPPAGQNSISTSERLDVALRRDTVHQATNLRLSLQDGGDFTSGNVWLLRSRMEAY